MGEFRRDSETALFPVLRRGGRVPKLCCKLHYFFAIFAMQDFLKKLGQRGGNIPDDQYQFLSVYICHIACHGLSRDYQVTFP